MRYIFAAGASAVVVPIADAIKWGPTLTIAAGIAVRLSRGEFDSWS